MSNRKYTWRDGRLFISLEEASDILRELADDAKAPAISRALVEVASLFELMELQTFEELARIEAERNARASVRISES